MKTLTAAEIALERLKHAACVVADALDSECDPTRLQERELEASLLEYGRAVRAEKSR